jgi:hypothetical protein
VTSLRIPREQLDEGLRRKVTTAVQVELLFASTDLASAIKWADKHCYNCDDLGDLLAQWALSGSPGGGGPDIEETSYRFYGLP